VSNQKTGSSGFVYQAVCKRCTQPFSYGPSALYQEVARGLSVPERCPECRRAHGSFVNSVSAAYCAPWPYDPSKGPRNRNVGLGRVVNLRPAPKVQHYDLKRKNDLLERFKGIDPVVQALIKELEDPNGARVNVLIGPTGSGKSVYSTFRMLDSELSLQGTICVTQPRLVTLRSASPTSDRTTPGYIARNLLGAPSSGAGQEIGYLYRGESQQQDKYNRLLFVTDGILIRWLVNDELDRFSVIFIDEAHEQSSNMELIFALLRYKLPLYPRLRVVIASGTIDPTPHKKYFGYGDPDRVKVFAPTDVVAKTPYPINDRWPEGDSGYAAKLPGFVLPKKPDQAPAAVATIVKAIREQLGFTALGNSNGDIITYAPTVGLVRRTIAEIERLNLPDLVAVPCFAQMTDVEYKKFRDSEAKAEKALRAGKPTKPQRVIVATNYAETSVTLSNLIYVIDSGYIMEPEWDPETHSRSYPTIRHTKAGVTQRKGRVGRSQPGEIFYLFTKEEFDGKNFSAVARPAIARESIDKFLLTAKAAGIENLESFEWLGFDPNSKTQQLERSRAIAALKARGALDAGNRLSSRGIDLEGVEAPDVDLATILTESDRIGCALEVATFVAFLDQPRSAFSDSAEGLLARSRWQKGCRDDLEFYLRLFNHWKNAEFEADHQAWSEKYGLNHRGMKDIDKRRVQYLRQFLHRTHTDPDTRDLDVSRLNRVRYMIMRALPDWVLMRQGDSPLSAFIPVDPECPSKSPLSIDRESSRFMSADLKYCLCLERQKIGMSVYGKAVVRLEPQWIAERRTLSTIGQALISREASVVPYLESEPSAEQVVGSKPVFQLDKSTLKVGATVRVTILQRFAPDGASPTSQYLVEDQATNTTFISKLEDGFFEPGDQYVAQVESFNLARSTVVLSRKAMFERYTVGKLIRGARIIKFLEDENGERYSALLELETGLEGRISLKSTGKSDGWFRRYGIGHRIDVVVRAKTGFRLDLALSLPKLEIGTLITGYVSGFLMAKERPVRIAAFIEVAPFVDGFLHNSKLGTTRLNMLSVGESINVRIVNVTLKNGKTNYELSI